jgi:hypothetical protein
MGYRGVHWIQLDYTVELPMKAMIVLVALAFATGSAFAADKEKKAPSPAQQAQQEKMKSCNAEARTKSLKGDERKKFMSECLKSAKK